MAGSLGLNVNDAKNQNISPLDKTSEEVRKAVSKHLQGQAVEALQQQTPKDVIAMINKLLPSEQQAAPAAGGTAIGQPPQTQTPEALPAISPQEQVQQILGQLANFQSQQAQPQTSPEAQALTGNKQSAVEGVDEGKLLQDLLTNIEFRKGSFLDPGGTISKEGDKTIITRPGLLARIGGTGKSDLQTLGDIQTLSGQEPLQDSDAQKSKLKAIETAKTADATLFNKRRDELFKSIESPMSSEAAKSLSQIESSLTALDNINSILGVTMDEKTGEVRIKNAQQLKNPNFLNKNRQALKRARDVFINKSLRRDSGAAISKDEEKSFKRIYGFDVGMSSYLKNPEVIAKSLVESQQQLSRDRLRLSPNEEMKSLDRHLKEQGFSKDQRADFYKRSGRL